MESNGAIGIAQAIASGDKAATSASNAQSEGAAGKAEADKEKEDKKKKLQEEQGKLGGVVNPSPFGNRGEVIPINGGELDKTNDEINRLTLDLEAKRKELTLKDEKQEQERLDAIDREARELQLLKDKKQRIEAEIKDNDEELKAFD